MIGGIDDGDASEGTVLDPMADMGGVYAASPPAGSTPGPNGTMVAPDGTTWYYNSATGQWEELQTIGTTGTTYVTPTFVWYPTSSVPPKGWANGLALMPPVPGQTCGSLSLPLGSDIPPVTQDAGKDLDIVNIAEVYESATFTDNPSLSGGLGWGGTTIVGYIYETASGIYFFQSTGADSSLVQSIASILNLSGVFTSITNGAISLPLTPAQVKKIEAKYPVKAPNKGSQPCFTNMLPKKFWS
jgi:hypothetical protein